jgi:hypothetical protein
LEAVLAAEDTDELTELEVPEALFEIELDAEDDRELSEVEA